MTHAPITARPAVPARKDSLDPILTGVVLALALAGIIVSASAREYQEAVATGLPMGILRSTAHLVVGLLFLVAVLVPDYHKLTRPGTVWAALGGVSVLLLAALVAGPEVGATHRFLQIAGVRFQPSELAKPVLILALAAALVRGGNAIKTPSGLARPMMLGGWLAGLVLAGKDLGTPTLLFGVTLVLAIVAGARPKHIAALVGAGAAIFTVFAFVERYRLARLTGFTTALIFRPENLGKVPYQLQQSLVAIGSGGVFGKGLGASTQKAFFLPEPDNDFVFAIIGEELGLVGALAVLAAFLVLAWRGLVTARRAPDETGRLIALGVTFLLVSQALCHMGVVTSLLPTKGLPLPFLSTGGSSIVTSCVLVGLLLNVSQRSRRGGGLLDG